MKRQRWPTMAAGLAAFVLGAVSIWGCQGSTTPTSPMGEKIFTSSTDANHSHTVTLARTDIESPGSGGISTTTGSSSSSGGHSHSFVMPRDRLVAVNEGSTVMIVTGPADGGYGVHTHTFTIKIWF